MTIAFINMISRRDYIIKTVFVWIIVSVTISKSSNYELHLRETSDKSVITFYKPKLALYCNC